MDKLKLAEEPAVWYEKGLPFKCTGCGQCCTGSPGYAWVTENEMVAIANYLNLPLKTFKMRYIRQVGARFALTELKKSNYDCVFLKDKRCTIYPVRPKQCRTYPWWPDTLKSLETWRAEAFRCEGIRSAAPVVGVEEIQKNLNEHLSNEKTVS